MKSGDKVRSLIRGLEILEAVNRHNGANLNQVAQETKLSRGTAYRMLESLCDAGFLERRTNSNGYWLSTRIPSLSAGYRSDAWISQIAEPALEKLTRTYAWPCSLLIPTDLRMIVLAHTEHLSPVTFRRRRIGLAMSMFDTSSGLVYLAFAAPETQGNLLSSAPSAAKAQSKARIGPLKTTLNQIHKRGYHVVDSPDRGSVLSVPILVNDAAFGSLSLRFFTSAMSHAMAVNQYLAPLRQTARELGKALSTIQENTP
ncbi:MAG: helix-turn-helix domain-containing protein [Rhodospirillaceae bacterium]|nr:helix-turn-helix domain-containing protein [Rhodospirillaceae bacterium]